MNAAWIRVALLLFGVAFGYVEASVVVYLRALSAPVRQRLLPQAAKDDLFPLIDWQRLQTESPETASLVPVEIVREAATIAMLAAIAGMAGRKFWLPAFAMVFGVWDASFYLFLKVLIDWPASVFTWDLLFLIPVPWTGPVLSPLLVSAALIGCGWAALGRRVPFGAIHWLALSAGSAMILASFTLDFREILNGAIPDRFAWPLFLAGWAAAAGAFLHALKVAASSKKLTLSAS